MRLLLNSAANTKNFYRAKKLIFPFKEVLLTKILYQLRHYRVTLLSYLLPSWTFFLHFIYL